MIVYQLLRGKVFQKGNVDVKDWITYQILNISLPIHHLIQPILKEYIEGYKNFRFKYILRLFDI